MGQVKKDVMKDMSGANMMMEGINERWVSPINCTKSSLHPSPGSTIVMRYIYISVLEVGD